MANLYEEKNEKTADYYACPLCFVVALACGSNDLEVDGKTIIPFYFFCLYSPGVMPVSFVKNFEKNEGLAKFMRAATPQIGRSLYHHFCYRLWILYV